MALVTEFIPLELDRLHSEAETLKTDGWRFIQTHAVNGKDGIDLYYSFMKDGRIANYRIAGVKGDQAVPSITDLFLAAFVFENEARELFGVDMRDIAIDFDGAMYAPAERAPMTFIAPEQKEALEKARKVAAAKAAKAAAAKAEQESPAKAEQEPVTSTEEETTAEPASSGQAAFDMTPERRVRLEAKLATMSPEKVAKVEAALKARGVVLRKEGE